MVVVMVVILWLLIRCNPADETHRAARATHAQSPRRQDTCHPDDRPTGPEISWSRASPRPRPGAAQTRFVEGRLVPNRLIVKPTDPAPTRRTASSPPLVFRDLGCCGRLGIGGTNGGMGGVMVRAVVLSSFDGLGGVDVR